MKKAVFALAILLLAAGAAWLFRRNAEAPRVPFAAATRENISNTLSTNGKVEPEQFVEVRTDTAGLVLRIGARLGEAVAKGAALAELAQPGMTEEIAAAEARVAQIRAELETLRAGGSSAAIAELDGSLNRVRGLREAALKNLASVERLVAANAATRYEADQARQTLADLDVQTRSLETRRTSLVGKGDLDASEARLREAEANLRVLRSRVAQRTVLAPMGGVLYDLPARPGSWLNAGDAVGSVGRLDPVRVKVFVDEPELGRVALGQAVKVTWDGLPGREWQGKIDRKATEVVALGSRQVGEVICIVANPDRELVPGTNVNAFILTRVVERALTIPKTAVRREDGVGVYVLRGGDSVAWRAISTGASSALRVEVTAGLQEGDRVALPSDAALKDGMKVAAGK